MSEKGEKIIVRRHPGATADEMSFFIKDSLRRYKPKRLIIFGGCNDESFASTNNKTEYDIVNSIMRMADEGRKSGCENVSFQAYCRGEDLDGIDTKKPSIVSMIC